MYVFFFSNAGIATVLLIDLGQKWFISALGYTDSNY